MILSLFRAKMYLMASILIKDTTSEQREQLVSESLGDDYDVGWGYESTADSKIRLFTASRAYLDFKI